MSNLSFKEKRALQKTVTEQVAALQGGQLGFKDKRQAQKLLRDALEKLGAGAKSAEPVAASLDVSGVKARVTEKRPMDAPEGWIVMNAPRPLLGQKTLEGGDFLAGRCYAALDPSDNASKNFLAENVKLDARVVMTISRDDQVAMALVGNKYASRYMEEFEGDERYEAVNPLDKLNEKTVGELESLLAQVKGSAVVAPAVEAEQEKAQEEETTGPQSLFDPILAGDFNNLAIPDFIKKLEEAYGEEEDLEKAKEGAVKYLEANRAQLEAA